MLPSSAWAQMPLPAAPDAPANESPGPEVPAPAPDEAPDPPPEPGPATPPERNAPPVALEAPAAAEQREPRAGQRAIPRGQSQADVAPVPSPSDAEPVEIRVLGSKASRAAGSVQVIREEQLKRFEHDDVGMALMQVPGVYLRQEDGMGLRPNVSIRGGNSDRSKKLTFMEDGVLFGPAPYSAPAAYFFPLLTRMTQIHVVKGPAAIAYGPQTVGGAIDMISRPIPSKTSGQVDLGLGQFGYNKEHAYLGSSNEQVGFLIEGARLQNTGFARLPDGADTGSTRNEWMIKASYLLDPAARISNQFSFKLLYSDEVSNETYLGQSDADLRADVYRRYPASALDQMKSHRTGLSLTHVMASATSPLKLKTTLYRSEYHRSWSKLNRLGGTGIASVLRNPDDPLNQGYFGVLTGEVDSGTPAEYLWIGPNDRNYVSQGVQTLLSTVVRTGPLEHGLEAGMRLHYDTINRRHTEDAYRMVGGRLVSADQSTLTTAYGSATSYVAALHVTDAITYRSLTVTPGIRTELIASQTEDYRTGGSASGFVPALMPGVGAYFEIVPSLGALGGVYRGFSPPPPASNDSVSPEYSVNYELGGRYSKGRTRLEAIGFYNDYQNMTDICTLASGCVNENLDRQFDAGRARIYGFEVGATYEAELGRGLTAPLGLAYTFSRGAFLNSFESQDPIYGSVSVDDEIPYLPPHQLTGSLALEHRYGGVNGAFNYVARMREMAGSGELIDALATDEQVWLDAGVFGRPLSWLTLYGNLRNLTGAQNLVSRRPYGARVNAPRWIQVGAKAEF